MANTAASTFGGATAPAAPAPAPAQKKPSVADWSKSRLLRTLRVANLCNGLWLMTVGVLIFIVQALSITFTTVVVAAFVVFFGLLLTCLECNVGSSELSAPPPGERGRAGGGVLSARCAANARCTPQAVEAGLVRCAAGAARLAAAAWVRRPSLGGHPA